ncbi:hypothetical protein WA026_011052 [Henosepilachna vigintioctopunctata]|uniref:N-acyl-aliphatic-L-amino acid amidohydrolase n=1 Tax=Henosepilachna vigintioctopunctata TaxID=420089 RepID=A0AAW1TWJ7_9CUCU
MEVLNKIAVDNLRHYLQIPSVHPNVDYDECVELLQTIGKDLSLPVEVIFVKPKKPVVIITWKGQRPELKSILLNSHMDVVPVFEEEWKYKPFSAEIVDGKIYGRGAQDMKSIGIQYLEAIRRLKLEGHTFKRTIYVCFVPDEEIGGEDGMNLFVQTEFFKKMNVGASLDESVATEKKEFRVFYGEKNCWQFTIHCKGPTGHGSLLLERTSGEKVTHLLNKVYEYRNGQKRLMGGDPSNIFGNIASINCTKIRGGVQDNVIPQEIAISFDCRIPSSYNHKEFEDMLSQWCTEAGGDCDIEYHQKDEPVLDTSIDESNIFWNAFRRAAEKSKIQFIHRYVVELQTVDICGRLEFLPLGSHQSTTLQFYCTLTTNI